MSITYFTDVSYTCPMHPEIVQDKPGSCPKCGMALERVVLEQSTKDEENEELTYMSRRFWITLFFSLSVFIVAMVNDLLAEYIPDGISMLSVQYFLFVFSTPVVLWGGWPFFVRGYNSIRTWNLNMFTLIALGVAASYIYSVFALFLPHIFPPLMKTQEGLVHVYFEAAAVITSLVLLGQVLELKARSKTNSAIKDLLDLAPKKAHLIKDGDQEDIDLIHVKVGDTLSVKPGEKIPVDGVVIKGKSNVDESMITGEAILISKTKGDSLIGATINKNGSLIMKAQRVGSDTMLSQIVHMVSNAQRSRAPIQNLADKVSSYFVPVVVVSALLSFFVWYVFGPEPRLSYAVVSAVAVLIIACPCALGLATPISIMVGTGRAAMSGILIKDAKTLQRMQEVDVLVVDKTGTLTQGRPEVTSFILQEGHDKNDVLKYAYSLENSSEHPLSDAVVRYAKAEGVSLLDTKDFNAISGKGIRGEIEGKEVVIGSEAFLNSLDIFTDSKKEKADQLRKSGKSVFFVAIESKLSALIGIQDPIKETSLQAIKELKKEGIKVVMLSGDNQTTADVVAKELGIDEVYANVLPDAKADVIKELQKNKQVVAMAGDGINDAPALASADVAIAMGSGTDVAIESAGITLIKGDLLLIVKVLKLSRATMKNIKQNLFFAFVYNSVGVPIAAGVLYPFFGILLSPVIAATAMSFSSVSVIVNALRLKSVKI